MKQMKLLILLTFLLLINQKAYTQAPVGDSFSDPINAGTYSASFSYTDSKSTLNYTKQYSAGGGRIDIFYKFTITTMMDVKINLCGSTDYIYTYLLDAAGNQLDFKNHGCSAHNNHPYMNKLNLVAGTYYVVNSCYSPNIQTIKTQIEGVAAPLPGDTRATAIDAGTHNSFFHFADARDTKLLYSNQYQGSSTNDVFYKFTITAPMNMMFLLCGSLIRDTYVYVLNSSGTVIASHTYTYSKCCCSVGGSPILELPNLAPGTYYVVSEGVSENGRIYTEIVGKNPNAPGNTQATAINTGTYGADFSYSDTKNNTHYEDKHPGRSGPDIFYKFTTTTPMNVTTSHCGSEMKNTYLHLLNASGGTIAYNEGDPSGCATKTQAYLTMSNLSPGTYYVVSEGATAGNIITRISGTKLASTGDTRTNPIDAGTRSSSFTYSDTRNTASYTNQYTGRPANDVFYKLVTTATMNMTISHCGSGVSDTYLYVLDASGALKYSNDDNYSSGCSDGAQSYLTITNLSPGTYYIVSEGYSQNGNITTTIAGTVSAPSLPGDTRASAIDAGTRSSSFTYSDTRNTTSYTDQYAGRSTNDVFYKLVTTATMNMTISHCGSDVSDTYLYVLDASEVLKYSNDDNSSGCSNRTQSYLAIDNLPPGTYYIVSEGYSENGNITTSIAGTVPAPALPGDTRTTAVDAGTYNSSFTYSDTRNTTNYTNQYSGQSTNDVFYKLVTTAAMNITISHCGSEVGNTYLHLLNSAGSRIDYNDDNPSGCSNGAQSYLTKTNLPAGTYYVVSEGYNQNGNITTTMTGTTSIQEPVDPVFSSPAVSLSTNQNYILTKTAREAVSNPASLTTANSMQTVRYFDGLGRPVETIQVAASPERKDIITYQEYDNYGRESKEWLPADYTGANGSFRTLSTVQSTTPAANGNDTRPFSEIQYEPSPLNRINKITGPGQAWSTHPVGTEYATNTSTSGVLSCTYYYVSGDNPVKSGNYSSGQLYVVKTTDEDGHVSYEFTDKLGRIVLQRQISEGISHDTYYIYDDFGNLRYVLPPLAAEASNLTDAIAKYGYVYKYDERNRCTEKKLPGTDAIYYVYDKADRLVLSQDGVQRSSGGWTFYKYDPLGRIILSGSLTDRTSRATLASIYKNSVVTEVRGSTVMGYTNNSQPSVAASQVLLVNYYDDYTWNTTAALQQASTPSGYNPPHSTSSAKGLLTGTVVRTLNAADKTFTTTIYYDYKGNPVGKHRQNILSGYEHEYYTYNFAGEVTKKLLKHCNSANGELLSEAYTYEYDHAGRMKKKYYALNGGTSNLMASYRYNNLGRLLTKSTAGQELSTYQYNIRGWLTNLNGQRFIESLSYSGQYGGNIASVSWNSNNQGNQSYTFTYDHLNRIKQAAYSGTGGRNYNESFTYDKHGNPLTISRYGRIQNGASYSYSLIDNLSMPTAGSYAGNQLITITESVANRLDNDLMEFKKGTASSPHFAYDTNGNLTKDAHKNISSIQYNYLNLPKQVTFGDGKKITYTHDASGVKHEVEYYNPSLNPATSKTSYVSNKIYEGGTLSMILTEEGYLKKQGSNYTSFYYLKDHLGSNRIVMEGSSGGVVQVTNHYPFGMSFADNPPRDDQSVQRFKYTGKELDREHGLNLYDYSARMYDPAIGRFTTMDPLAEKYYSVSPYAYCLNNPIRYIDLRGDSVRVYTETQATGHVWMSVGEGDNMVVYSYGRYNGTNKGPDGSSNSLADGPGVLLRLTGDEAKAYNEEKASAGMSVFVVTDVADEIITTAMDERFNSSTITPDRGKYKANPSAHVIDKYSLISNNCTTVVSDVLNNNGSSALKGTTFQQTSTFGTWTTVPAADRFVLPASMQNYLIKISRPGSTVYRTR